MLPRLAFIADRFTRPERFERCLAAIEAGVSWIHLRDHEATPDDFLERAEALIGQIGLRFPQTKISVNANLEVAAAFETSFHTGRRGPDIEEARIRLGDESAIGFSAHSVGAGEAALRSGADYLFYSPVFATASKPETTGVGLTALEAFCEQFRDSVPVFALGGVAPDRVAECRRAGAYGVAVASGIAEAPDVGGAVEAYVSALSVEG